MAKDAEEHVAQEILHITPHKESIRWRLRVQCVVCEKIVPDMIEIAVQCEVVELIVWCGFLFVLITAK